MNLPGENPGPCTSCIMIIVSCSLVYIELQVILCLLHLRAGFDWNLIMLHLFLFISQYLKDSLRNEQRMPSFSGSALIKWKLSSGNAYNLVRTVHSSCHLSTSAKSLATDQLWSSPFLQAWLTSCICLNISNKPFLMDKFITHNLSFKTHSYRWIYEYEHTQFSA